MWDSSVLGSKDGEFSKEEEERFVKLRDATSRGGVVVRENEEGLLFICFTVVLHSFTALQCVI